MSEVWKDVEGYPGYKVSDQGRILGRRGNVIRGARDKNGYAIICVNTRTPNVKTLKVHKLVVEAFFGSIPEGMHVNHKNGIKDDNRSDNLEIVTPAENTRHTFRELGRVGKNTNPHRGSRHPNSVLTEDDVRRIRALHAGGMSAYMMYKDRLFPVSIPVLRGIIQRKGWAHVD